MPGDYTKKEVQNISERLEKRLESAGDDMPDEHRAELEYEMRAGEHINDMLESGEEEELAERYTREHRNRPTGSTTPGP